MKVVVAGPQQAKKKNRRCFQDEAITCRLAFRLTSYTDKEWLGHASIGTTRVYDRRGFRPEDSPTFKVAY